MEFCNPWLSGTHLHGHRSSAIEWRVTNRRRTDCFTSLCSPEHDGLSDPRESIRRGEGDGDSLPARII